MEIIQNDDGNSNNSEVTEKLIDDIINNKSKIIYTPICGELAYLPVEVTDKEKCDVYIGENLFIRTTFKRAKEIVKRRKEALSRHKVNKLSDDTYEIVEQLNDTSVNKTFNNMLNARNVEGTNKIDPQENITIQTKEKEKQINESNKQALFSHSSKKNILSTERYINEDKNDPLDNIIINDSALRSKSSMEFDSINFEDSFPNKPTNVLVVNDIIHDK